VMVVTSEVRLGVHCWRGCMQGIVRGEVHCGVQRDTIAKGVILKGFRVLAWSCRHLEP